MSLGLERAGFAVVAAADSDSAAIETHRANIEGLAWLGDLSQPDDFLDQLGLWGINKVSVVAGGPPCQPFSRAGTPKIGSLVREGKRSLTDTRSALWRTFFAVIDRLNPEAVLLENVPDFAEGEEGAALVEFLAELNQRGFVSDAAVLDAWRFGVPQHRSRIFIVGTKGFVFTWPKSRAKAPTLWDAIGDLPVVSGGQREEILPYRGKPVSQLGKWLRAGLVPGGPSPFSIPTSMRFSGLSSGQFCCHDELLRAAVAQPAVGTLGIVMPAPGLDLLAGILQREEPAFVETFRPQAGVEGLDQRVVGRFAGPAEVQSYLVQIGPLIEGLGREFGAVIDGDRFRSASLQGQPPEGLHHAQTVQAEVDH